jgi:hypothetical protein
MEVSFKDSRYHKIVECHGFIVLQEPSLAVVAYVDKLEIEGITF